MVGFRRRDEPFCPGKGDTGCECLKLIVSLCLYEAVPKHLADQWRHAVIAKTSGMDGRRHKAVAEGVHGQKRGLSGCITKVIDIGPFGHGRTGGRLNGNDPQLSSVHLVPDKGKGNTGEIASAAHAADDHVRIFSGLLHLLLASRPMMV